MIRQASFRLVIWSVALWAFTVAGFAANRPQQPAVRGPRADMSPFLPPGPGKDLVAKECSTHHDLAGVVKLRASRQAWEAVVLDMVARGAPLMIEDADAITAYLSEVFGPKAPPLVDVNTAAPEDLLKLPGITRSAADRAMTHRQEKGPFVSREEFRAVAGLEETAFEKIKWYVRAQR